MNIHLTKEAAHKEASKREVEANQKAWSPRHSSGHGRLRFGVKPKWLFFWKVVER